MPSLEIFGFICAAAADDRQNKMQTTMIRGTAKYFFLNWITSHKTSEIHVIFWFEIFHFRYLIVNIYIFKINVSGFTDESADVCLHFSVLQVTFVADKCYEI